MSDYSDYTNEELAQNLRADARWWFFTCFVSLLLFFVSTILLIAPDSGYAFMQIPGPGSEFIRANSELFLLSAALLSVISAILGLMRYRYLRGLANRLQALDE